MNTKRFMRLTMAALLIGVVFASCVPQKKMLYLKEAMFNFNVIFFYCSNIETV